MARDEHAGKKGQCPTCGNLVMIPSPGDAGTFSEEVEEEAPEEVSVSLEPPPPARKRFRRRSLFGVFIGSLDTGFLGLTRVSGILFMFAGLCLVVVSRGCDSTNSRSVSAASARYQLVQNEFEDSWDDKITPVMKKIEVLKETMDEADEDLKKERDEDDPNRARIERLNANIEGYEDEIKDQTEKLATLKKDKIKARGEAALNDWRDYEIAVRDASSSNRLDGWWLAWMFLGGTLILLLGLLTLAAGGEPQEKLISLVMIAIITFSIYVGGAAWVDSLFSSVEAKQVPRPGIRGNNPFP